MDLKLDAPSAQHPRADCSSHSLVGVSQSNPNGRTLPVDDPLHKRLCDAVQAVITEYGHVPQDESLEGSGPHIQHVEGAFNHVYIVTISATRMVFRLPRSPARYRQNEPAAEALDSHVQTLEAIHSSSTITMLPVPTVYDHSSVACGPLKRFPLGSPFIAMSYIDGVRASDLWNHGTEDARRAFISNSAKAIGTLVQILRYPSFGALSMNPDNNTSVTVVPRFVRSRDRIERVENTLMDDETKETVYEFLSRNKLWEAPDAPNPSDLVIDSLMQDIVNNLPCGPTEQNSEPFALFPPNLDLDHILVDRNLQGCITGFLDWELASLEPDFVCYGRLPDWLHTSDGSCIYGWPGDDMKQKSETEARLFEYQQIYSNAVAQAIANKRFETEYASMNSEKRRDSGYVEGRRNEVLAKAQEMVRRGHVQAWVWDMMRTPKRRRAVCTKIFENCVDLDSGAMGTSEITDLGNCQRPGTTGSEQDKRHKVEQILQRWSGIVGGKDLHACGIRQHIGR